MKDIIDIKLSSIEDKYTKGFYWEDFSKPKIIYPNMTKYMPFIYDEAYFLTNQKCFIIAGQNMAYLTAFLNSSLFKYCFRDSFPELQGGTRELSKIFFDKIPEKQVSLEQNEKFRKIVNSVQSDYTVTVFTTDYYSIFYR